MLSSCCRMASEQGRGFAPPSARLPFLFLSFYFYFIFDGMERRGLALHAVGATLGPGCDEPVYLVRARLHIAIHSDTGVAISHANDCMYTDVLGVQ